MMFLSFKNNKSYIIDIHMYTKYNLSAISTDYIRLVVLFD